MDRRCDCIMCMIFNQPEVLFDLLRLGQRGPVVLWVSPFWYQSCCGHVVLNRA